MAYKIPNVNELGEMLEMLLGRTPKITEVEAPPKDSHAAVYVDPEDAPVAMCLCDLNFAAYSSSALSMIPPDEANNAVSSGALQGLMEGNLYEVMNIFSNLLMSTQTPHLKLVSVAASADGDGAESLGTTQRADFEVDFEGYGAGQVSFVAT